MKIRADYVSNSSSSSFVISLTKDYDMDKFIKDVVKACSHKADSDNEPDFIKDVDAFNRRNLDYCMNTYKLLFLGSLKVDDFTGTIHGKEYVKMFLDDIETMKDTETKIILQEEDKITYTEPNWVEGVTVTQTVMEFDIKTPDWMAKNMELDEDDAKKRTAKNIVDCANASASHGRFFRSDTSDIYEITLDTIENTKALIDSGYKVELDDWCKDLDALKSRIENGNRLFGIRMNQGGDGMSPFAIYALNGWDSDFNEFANVEILGCND